MLSHFLLVLFAISFHLFYFYKVGDTIFVIVNNSIDWWTLPSNVVKFDWYYPYPTHVTTRFYSINQSGCDFHLFYKSEAYRTQLNETWQNSRVQCDLLKQIHGREKISWKLYLWNNYITIEVGSWQWNLQNITKTSLQLLSTN